MANEPNERDPRIPNEGIGRPADEDIAGKSVDEDADDFDDMEDDELEDDEDATEEE